MPSCDGRRYDYRSGGIVVDRGRRDRGSFGCPDAGEQFASTAVVQYVLSEFLGGRNHLDVGECRQLHLVGADDHDSGDDHDH